MTINSITVPLPLVTEEVDLRDFPFMPIDITRLFNSEFHARATDSEWRAGMTLYLKSFHQVPSASIPDDDILLARLAEFGRDVKGWGEVREMALHGWIKCADGRLYHPVVAEKSIAAWIGKQQQRGRTAKARQTVIDRRAAVPVTTSVTGSRERRIGIGIGIGEREADSSLPAPSSHAACRLDESWQLPAEWADWARMEKPDWTNETVLNVAAKFKGYWIAIVGDDAKKGNWRAAWQRWVKKEREPDQPLIKPKRNHDIAARAQPAKSAEGEGNVCSI